MATIDSIRNGIIDKLMTISDKTYLMALHDLVERSAVDQDSIKLSKEQLLMLESSEEDIKNGKLVSQDELDKADLKWLNAL